MIVNRNIFFLLLVVVFVGPFYAYKAIWIASSRRTTGLAWFMGHTLELQNGISQHLVILYKVGKDSLTFNAGDNIGFRVGDLVPVRYQRDNPADARIDIPVCIWGDTWVNSLMPVLVLLVLYLTPDFLDPLIPRRSKIRVGTRPFIRIIPPGGHC